MEQPRVELVSGIAGLEQLAPHWKSLWRQVPDASHLHLWEWHRSYLGALCPEPNQALYAALYDGGAPVAMLPLERRAQRLGGIVCRTLSLPSHDHMDQADMLVRPDWRSRLRLAPLMSALRASGVSCDALVLGPVLEDSAVHGLVTADQESLQISQPSGHSDALPTLPYDQLLQRMSKNFRGNLRKARNKLERTPEVRVVHATTPAELASAFLAFLQVEASGWKGAQGTAIAMDPSLEDFYRQLVDRLGPEGRCEIRLLLAGDRPLATQFGIVGNQRLFLLKIGYDEAHAQLAPGNLLLEDLLRSHANHPSIQFIDLVTDADWHGSWRPVARATFRHVVLSGTTRGRMAWAALRGKEALRPVRRLVSEHWQRLRAPQPSPAGRTT